MTTPLRLHPEAREERRRVVGRMRDPRGEALPKCGRWNLRSHRGEPRAVRRSWPAHRAERAAALLRGPACRIAAAVSVRRLFLRAPGDGNRSRDRPRKAAAGLLVRASVALSLSAYSPRGSAPECLQSRVAARSSRRFRALANAVVPPGDDEAALARTRLDRALDPVEEAHELRREVASDNVVRLRTALRRRRRAPAARESTRASS